MELECGNRRAIAGGFVRQLIDGAMQRYALTLDKFLGHAAKWHADAQVVGARDDGAAHST